MIVATAGHVDHGKSSLVRALTGTDPDRLAEEKRRGMTIDLGYAYCGDADERIGFVDVPGHQRFLHNMLAGVNGIDLALIVVAADDSVMPQTIEHLQILGLLGVKKCIGVITKIDRVPHERVSVVEAELRALLTPQGTPGGLALEAIVRTCPIDGQGIDELRERLRCQAKTLTRNPTGQLFRFAIDRVFTRPGVGTIVTGFVHSGSVQNDQELLLLPDTTPARVRGIHTLDQEAPRAHAGERAALNLANLSRDQIHRGQWLTASDFGDASYRFHARAHWVAPVASGWRKVHLYHASQRSVGRIHVTPLDSDINNLVEVRSDAGFCVVAGDRLIVRDESDSKLVAGLEVIDLASGKRHRRAAESWLKASNLDDALSHLARDGEYVHVEALRRVYSVPSQLLAQMLEANAWATHRINAQLMAIPATRLSKDVDAVIGIVRSWQKANPHLAGMRVPQMQAITRGTPSKQLAFLLELCEKQQQLTHAGGFWSTPDHRPKLERSEEQLWQSVRALLINETRPPVVHELARRLNRPPDALRAALVRFQHFGLLIPVTDNRFFLPAHLDRLATLAEALQAEGLTAAIFRDRSDLGRNLAVDVLEYFDRVGFTRRRDEQRVVTRPASAWLRAAS